MVETRHLCGNCRECLKAERDILKGQLAEIDNLIEKRKMLTHESFYSIDLRKLIELRSKQNDNNS